MKARKQAGEPRCEQCGGEIGIGGVEGVCADYGSGDHRTYSMEKPMVEFEPGKFLDIHFRMLHWRELAAATGFPKDYDFAGNREEIVKQIGNAVPIGTARTLCETLIQ